MPSINNKPVTNPKTTVVTRAAEAVFEGVAEFREQANIFAGWEDGFLGAMYRESGETRLEAAARLAGRSGVHLVKGATPDLSIINLTGSVVQKEGLAKGAYYTGAGIVIDALEAIPQGAVALTQALAAAWHLAAAPFDNSEGSRY